MQRFYQNNVRVGKVCLYPSCGIVKWLLAQFKPWYNAAMQKTPNYWLYSIKSNKLQEKVYKTTRSVLNEKKTSTIPLLLVLIVTEVELRVSHLIPRLLIVQLFSLDSVQSVYTTQTLARTTHNSVKQGYNIKYHKIALRDENNFSMVINHNYVV